MNIQFRKTEESRANKLYLHILFEGGDADTKHPQEIELKGITFGNYKEHIPEIAGKVHMYKILKEILDEHMGDKSVGYDAAKEISEDMASLYDNVPNDPESDYSYKCYLSEITLIGYDETGAKYESYC